MGEAASYVLPGPVKAWQKILAGLLSAASDLHSRAAARVWCATRIGVFLRFLSFLRKADRRVFSFARLSRETNLRRSFSIDPNLPSSCLQIKLCGELRPCVS